MSEEEDKEGLTTMEEACLKYMTAMVDQLEGKTPYRTIEYARQQAHAELMKVAGFGRFVVSKLADDYLDAYVPFDGYDRAKVYDSAMKLADKLKEMQRTHCRHGNRIGTCVYECGEDNMKDYASDKYEEVEQ